jgi:glycosyltransferase involved in cell wall biosynthesis
MPVIVTDAIVNSKQIENAGCGIVIQYNVKELADAVIKLLLDEKLLKEYRRNAVRFVEQFDYESIFSDNINRLLEVNR